MSNKIQKLLTAYVDKIVDVSYLNSEEFELYGERSQVAKSLKEFGGEKITASTEKDGCIFYEKCITVALVQCEGIGCEFHPENLKD